MAYVIIFLFAFLVAAVVFLYQQIIISRLPFLVKAFLAIFLTFSIMLGSYIREMGLPEGSTEGKILSPIAEPIVKSIEVIRHVIRSQEIEKIVLDETKGQEENYAVAIKNLKTGEEYFKDENKKFSSGSLYKLWVMAEVYNQIDKGKLTLETKLSDSVQAINKRFGLASESAELKEGSISQSVKTALEQMITISSNYSAYLLTSKVGSKNIKQTLSDYNFSDSSFGTLTSEPSTTPLNIFQFFEKLYKKELISKIASDEMIEILKRQKLNDRIPKYLPKDIEIAHKTGELYGFKHNAGIVFSPKGDYIIVLFSETNSPIKAAEIEAKISKRVWDYFNK